MKVNKVIITAVIGAFSCCAVYANNYQCPAPSEVMCSTTESFTTVEYTTTRTYPNALVIPADIYADNCVKVSSFVNAKYSPDDGSIACNYKAGSKDVTLEVTPEGMGNLGFRPVVLALWPNNLCSRDLQFCAFEPA